MLGHINKTPWPIDQVRQEDNIIQINTLSHFEKKQTTHTYQWAWSCKIHMANTSRVFSKTTWPMGQVIWNHTMTIQINRLDHDGTQLDQTTQQTMPCQKQHDPTTKSSSNDIIPNRRQHEKNNIHALGHAKLCFQNHLLVRCAAKGTINLRAPSLCSPSASHPRADTYTRGC